jgi:hypothetical protein
MRSCSATWRRGGASNMTVSKRGETSELRDADLAAADCVS